MTYLLTILFGAAALGILYALCWLLITACEQIGRRK